MSDIIQLLPDHVANQIAAGEVVQRPASVVKELLENAIDAGASQIKLIIKDAGKTLIQVIDDGKGMSVTDARLCFERHATSKIKDAQDLFNLNTKGFRGEAMASIAAIAHVDLKTRQENEELGTCIKIEGSKIVSQEVDATSKGTSVAVKNLFYNIPARRNFLKSDTVETRHIVNEFQRVALAHNEIGFSMNHNNSEVYNLKEGNLKQRIVAVLGGKTNEKLVPIEEHTDVIEISGFAAKPEFSKKKRGEQFFFVNDRFIKSSYLHHAVTSAFDGLLGSGYHPSYFLYLRVPPESIDINIHPTKTEIKFDNEKVLYAIIRASVKHSLGQYNVAPVLDFNRDSSMDTPYALSSTSYSSTPNITVDPNFNPFETSAPKVSSSHSPSSHSNSNHYNYQKENTDNWEALYTTIETDEPSFSQSEMSFESDFENETTGKTFQIQRKYILSSIKSGVVLIHQNLAHQRILYEEFLENITVKEAPSQQLLFPVEISFEKQDIELIKELQEDLENTGFLFDKITKESIVVKGIPTTITESQINIIIEQLLDDLKDEIPETSFSQLDIISKSLAKSLAIKTGNTLSGKEQENLVNNLFSCKDPSISPFGKKTFETLTIGELDKIFTSKI
ncbi:DNA mismatch repair endonuclease MutL [Flavicella sediminum]|uniref:DNA mismatch repair endonuclease MutL n=1 Tax=Flavicella sediminum TaxID=2585141 RepID=UPI001123D0B9|nr:DNA mismatch repair endonuclease MutL [Flavicella sediminum]